MAELIKRSSSTAKPSADRYQAILTDIETLYTNARKTMVEMYWRIGKRIVEAEQGGEAKAPYGTQLLEALSSDLTERLGSGFSLTSLKNMRRLYLCYRKSPPADQLTWAKHVELLTVKDPKKRQAIEKRVIREGLLRDDIRQIVQQEISSEAGAVDSETPKRKIVQLSVKRGRLATYSEVEDSKVVLPRGMVTLDLGFDVWRMAEKDELTDVTLTDKPQYTYSARVEKLIDGDTLWAQIDVGFGCVTRQKLRLRGIDAPEIDTDQGKKAKAFVEARLKKTGLIIIKTYKDDKYGRYLADVFYLAGEQGASAASPEAILQSGTFLNQELLDGGLAKVWQE